MGKVLERITDELARWMEEQPLFFVATAPADPETRVNVSPRGLDTFRVLDEHRVGWLDLTGSGVETIAHLKADPAGDGASGEAKGEAGGRITLMFCAFSGPPKIIRLYGRGRVHEPTDRAGDAYTELHTRFPELPGERTIVEVEVDRVANSCGFGVPLMDLVGERKQLSLFAKRKGEEGMAAYREEENAESIDGRTGLALAAETQEIGDERA